MGKKKTPVFRDGSANQKKRNDGKVKAIRTWDDIEHDSEDEFHDARGKILLENNQDEHYNELSDEEVYGLDGLDSDQEEEEEEENDSDDERLSDDEIIGGNDEEQEKKDSWGRSKKAYYNADEGSDLDEMREEEEEALRIQKEQLASMEEGDFVDDTVQGWGLGNVKDDDADKQMVESVSRELDDISFDVSKTAEKRRQRLPVAEKLKLLQNESPELIELLDEFKDKAQTLSGMEDTVTKLVAAGKQEEEEGKFILLKYQTLMSYMANISFYFVLKSTDTTDLRDHPVIQALVQYRTTLEKIDTAEKKLRPRVDLFIRRIQKGETVPQPALKQKNKTSAPELDAMGDDESDEDELDNEWPVMGDETEQLMESESEEETQEASIDDIEQEFKSLRGKAKKRRRAHMDDFGELDALDDIDFEDKQQKKRSIRDYVAKIDSKLAKAQAKYQGDSDLPYKDRTRRDIKGVPQPEDTSADLDDADWDVDDIKAAQDANTVANDDDNDDDYYDKVASSKKAEKTAKKEAYEAERLPNEDINDHVEDGQKRLATYQILKNKGLTPYRKKENRNARVKHRNRFASKVKKLSSVRQVHKPLAGGYGGETTGIKSRIIRSVKL